MKLGKDYVCNGQMDIFDFINQTDNVDTEENHKPIPYITKMNNNKFAKCPKCGERVIEYSKDEKCKSCGWKLDWSWWDKNYYTTSPTEKKDCSWCQYGEYGKDGGVCNYPGNCIRNDHLTLKKEYICHATNETCNLMYRREVARDIGCKCVVNCCQACTENCGARCNYSAHQPQVLKEKVDISNQTWVDNPNYKDNSVENNISKTKYCDECDVEWCSLICYERRGYMRHQGKWVRNPDGEKTRRAIENRECKIDIANWYKPIEDYASHGTRFENGKKRIREYFDKEKSTDSRAKFLKKEYGWGGFCGPCKEPHKIFDAQANCFGKDNVIKYYDTKMEEIELVVTWKELAETIDKMIREDRY